MKLTKEKNEFGTQINLKGEDSNLLISFGGTGDLYWRLNSDDINKINSITITKENYALYRLFEQLYIDIKDINLYEDFDEDKELYRKYNHSNYNELFDEENRTITWYSDETAHIVANYVKIKKEDKSFKISFHTQQDIEGYEEDSKSDFYVAIRFRNSGSSYYPFNAVFMKMYYKLVDLEDVNVYGHQIHMEEYLYEKEKANIKVLKKIQ